MNYKCYPNIIWIIQLNLQEIQHDNLIMETINETINLCEIRGVSQVKSTLQKICVVYIFNTIISYDKLSYDTKSNSNQVNGEINHGR
jgi:hypothetical protein